jgi:hypothetical protein
VTGKFRIPRFLVSANILESNRGPILRRKWADLA